MKLKEKLLSEVRTVLYRMVNPVSIYNTYFQDFPLSAIKNNNK